TSRTPGWIGSGSCIDFWFCYPCYPCYPWLFLFLVPGEEMPAERNPVRILSIDGGGIRGVIPALVLAELQTRVGNAPLLDPFDLVAGPSTGGLIALGLNVRGPDGKPRYTAQDMVNLYTEDGPRIFSRSFWYRLTSLGGLRRPRYPVTGLEAVLREKFGSVQ